MWNTANTNHLHSNNKCGSNTKKKNIRGGKCIEMNRGSSSSTSVVSQQRASGRRVYTQSNGGASHIRSFKFIRSLPESKIYLTRTSLKCKIIYVFNVDYKA
jgi:hypothetical protein